MKQNARRLIAIIIICIMAMQWSSCNVPDATDGNPRTVRATVIEIEKYGHAVLDVTTSDFISAGYELGDVVSVRFGDDEFVMPFFDGYYSNPGHPMLRGASVEENIAVCINYGSFSELNGIEIGDTAEITISEKATMLPLQELYSLKYSNDREDYKDDATFANFRVVTAGGIGYGKLYRTASPINNERGRAAYADDLIEARGVVTVLNLADANEDIEEYLAGEDFNSPYYRSLYESGSVIALDLAGNFYSDDFAASVADGLTFLAQNEGPYCIHCTEGKDRAGFTAMLLEALMGATLDEIIDDYMLSFYNYYGISKENEPKRYQAVLDVNLMEMMCHVMDVESVEMLRQTDLSVAVTEYLIDAGMSNEDILTLKEKLS